MPEIQSRRFCPSHRVSERFWMLWHAGGAQFRGDSRQQFQFNRRIRVNSKTASTGTSLSACSPTTFCAGSANASRSTTTHVNGKRSAAYSAPTASSPPGSRSPTDARSISTNPANPTTNKNASTKCSASTGNPPFQLKKPKSQHEEIVVPLERPLRFYAGLRASVRNLG